MLETCHDRKAPMPTKKPTKDFLRHEEDLKVEKKARELIVAHVMLNHSCIPFFPVGYLQSLLRLLDRARIDAKTPL